MIVLTIAAVAMATLVVTTASTASAGIFDDPGLELTDPSITASQTAHATSHSVDRVFDDNLGSQYATGSPTNAIADAFIDFDFGTATSIGGFVFHQRNVTADQVTDFDLIFSNNSDFSLPVATLNFATSGGDFTLVTGTSTARQEFEFASSVATRYVRWEVNASGNIYDGAAEMEFWAPIPEPSALVLAALGLLGLIGFGRRRKR